MEGFLRARAFVFRLLMVGIITFPLTALAERVQDLPKPTDYVSDFAHVLSPQAVERLDRICAELDHSKAVGRVALVIAIDSGITLGEEPVAPRMHRAGGGSALAKLIPFLILFLIFGGFGFMRLLFGVGLVSSALGGRRYGGGPFIGGGGFGGGGFGGGGGSSGGGGFGGFGGGSFGGGGAGGDW